MKTTLGLPNRPTNRTYSFGTTRAAAPSDAAPVAAAQRVGVRASTAGVQMWDMSSGTAQAVSGASTARVDPVLTAATANARRVDDFFRNTFGRNGWDDHGSALQVVVHAPNEDGTPYMNNAYWDVSAKRIYLGDGDGRTFAPLGGSLDVLVHEATHAVVDAEVNLRYEGIQGGLNESWADVLATVADPDDWLIGEDVMTPGVAGDAIRDLAHPTYGNVAALPDGVTLEPHDYSGIPSLVAVRVATQLGRQDMGQIWYRALVEHLDDRAGYAGAARATLDAAVDLHGAGSAAVDAVLAAWRTVGVNPRWKGATPG